VLAGVQRHADPGHPPDRAAPHAGAVDHDLGVDPAELGLDPTHPAVLPHDARDLAALDDPCPVLARPLGQRLGDIDRVGLAVRRDVDGAREVADGDQRVQRFGLGRREFEHLETARAAHRGLAPQLGEPGGSAREADAAVLLEAGRLPGFRLEAEVKLRRVFREAREIRCRAQLADQPGSVPGGAAGQLFPLQQHHVAPAELGQMVGDRAADHSAADDHRLRVTGQISSHDVLSLGAGPIFSKAEHG
jgi:hypothetical protein